MGRVIFNGPPDAPGLSPWCPVCLMMAKQQQWELNQDRVKEGHEAPGDKTTVIAWPAGLTEELQPGEYRAVNGDAPQLGIVDGLCWNHVAGMQPYRPSSLVDGNGVPAGLIKGRG